MVKFTVSGAPQGKGRPRFTRAGHTYTPKNTAEYERRIIRSYHSSYNEMQFAQDDPIAVYIEALFEPPKSISQVKRARMLQSGYPTKKPDIDNICKVFMDAMNGVVYPDDKQIVSVVMTKTYGECACVNVSIERVSE